MTGKKTIFLDQHHFPIISMTSNYLCVHIYINSSQTKGIEHLDCILATSTQTGTFLDNQYVEFL